jgi:NAD dependent epimerase/dehydratase family enzyme
VFQNLPVPTLAIQALFDERAAVALGSTRLAPQVTQASSSRCRFETVEQALDDLLVSQRGGVRLRVWEQWLR